MFVKKKHKLPIKRQCELLSIHRSGLYYKPKPESELNIELMRVIDERYVKTPFYGIPRMWDYLRKEKGYKVNAKRIERLYKLMGLEAIGPKPNTSKRNKHHQVYPYLLKGLKTERSNQVWATDITYIPMRKGFMYLMAIIDLHSRYVVNWSVSNSMDATWCATALKEAIAKHGKPEIINSDQGSQFSSDEWIEACKGIQISMDGKGRAIDNIFIERLWRTVKYEHVYLNPAENGLELFQGFKQYFNFYNNERSHQSLEYSRPVEVFNNAA